MSATVTTLLTNLKTISAGVLGGSWHPLRNVMDLQSNDLRTGAKGYGVRALSASSAATVTNTYALDHVFEVVLMDTVPRKDDESQAMTVIGTLFDLQDEIFKQIVRTKAGTGGTVILVSEPSLAEPEFVSGKEFVALRQQFLIRYRQTI
jgi:hypothetical protein